MSESTKQKGDFLEEIIRQLCEGVDEARVTKNATVLGKKTGSNREIDVLIEGQYHLFDVKIAIESKNHAKPVGVEKVESFKAKLEDIGADLGVMVCPTGFTDPAKRRAEFDGIQVYEIYDPGLGNTNLFIPLRFIDHDIKSYSIEVHGKFKWQFSIPADPSRWRFHIRGEVFDGRQLSYYAWNNGMTPQEAGDHVADFGAVIISDAQGVHEDQYCELKLHIKVVEKYYLKLLPASFLKNSHNNKEHFNLRIDLYSRDEDMVNNGWKKFDTLEEMNRAADIENQPEGVRNLILRAKSTYEDNRTS